MEAMLYNPDVKNVLLYYLQLKYAKNARIATVVTRPRMLMTEIPLKYAYKHFKIYLFFATTTPKKKKKMININSKNVYTSFECVFEITLLETAQLLNMKKKNILINFRSIKDKFYIGQAL